MTKQGNHPDINRRRSLALMGAAGVLSLASRAFAQIQAPACTVTPQQTEGPFFVDTRLQRSDIRADPGSPAKPGVPLALSLRVLSVTNSGCTPLAGALVDVWHCDAAGVYSGVDGNAGRFLRGQQLSDRDGRVRFMSIYPGWYPGRAVHVHFKLRGSPAANAGGRGYEFTSQLYFDGGINDKVLAAAPYARAGSRTRNESDSGFRAGGSRLLLALTPSGAGYAGTFDIGLRST